jgi:hypothetical protein
MSAVLFDKEKIRHKITKLNEEMWGVYHLARDVIVDSD